MFVKLCTENINNQNELIWTPKTIYNYRILDLVENAIIPVILFLLKFYFAEIFKKIHLYRNLKLLFMCRNEFLFIFTENVRVKICCSYGKAVFKDLWRSQPNRYQIIKKSCRFNEQAILSWTTRGCELLSKTFWSD